MPIKYSHASRGVAAGAPRAPKQPRSRESAHAGGSLKRCFCAFCKSPRSIYSKTHISIQDVALAAVGSVLFGWLVWQSLDPRAFMFFGFGLGVAEIFVIVRRKLSIACPKCGFDSHLYRRDSQAAVARVKQFRIERFEDPLWIFSPPVQPPAQVRAPAQLRARTRAHAVPHIRSGSRESSRPASRSPRTAHQTSHRTSSRTSSRTADRQP